MTRLLLLLCLTYDGLFSKLSSALLHIMVLEYP